MTTMLTRRPSCRPRSSLRGHLSIALVILMASSAFGLALITSVINASSASAHAKLVKVTPKQDAQLTTAPKEVTLEFSETLSTSFTTVVVTTAAGASVTLGKPKVVGAKAIQALSPRLASGTYRILFRVVSHDGHPVTGESGFTLKLQLSTSAPTSTPSASPLTTPSATVATVAPAEGSDAGPGAGTSRTAMAIAGAVGLLIVGAGVMLWRRERT